MSVYIVCYDTNLGEYKAAFYNPELSSDLEFQLKFHLQSETVHPVLLSIIRNIPPADFSAKIFTDKHEKFAICRFTGPVLPDDFARGMFRAAYYA